MTRLFLQPLTNIESEGAKLRLFDHNVPMQREALTQDFLTPARSQSNLLIAKSMFLRLHQIKH